MLQRGGPAEGATSGLIDVQYFFQILDERVGR